MTQKRLAHCRISSSQLQAYQESGTQALPCLVCPCGTAQAPRGQCTWKPFRRLLHALEDLELFFGSGCKTSSRKGDCATRNDVQAGGEAGWTKELTNRPFPGQGGEHGSSGHVKDRLWRWGLPGFSIGSPLNFQPWLGYFSSEMTSGSLDPRQCLSFFFCF